MHFTDVILLFIPALLAGAVNSVAGGGTFFTFPALLLAGVPPVVANATSAVAVWPGTISSAYAYRNELVQEKQTLRSLIVVGLIGGVLGGALLLLTPEQKFSSMIPWLMLTAAFVFTFGKKFTAWVRASHNNALHHRTIGLLMPFMQFVLMIYGGYFGAGFGIVMLALLQLMGHDHIHRMNAVKITMACINSGAGIVIFILSGLIHWPIALLMMVGAAIGGFLGAHSARKLPPTLVRGFVIGVAWAMTAYFFWEY